MEPRICRHCEVEFNPKNKFRGGYIDECDDCSSEKTEKYVGRLSGSSKAGDAIEIFRENISYWRATLKRESMRGFGPNLPVSHPVIETKKEEMKERANDG